MSETTTSFFQVLPEVKRRSCTFLPDPYNYASQCGTVLHCPRPSAITILQASTLVKIGHAREGIQLPALRQASCQRRAVGAHHLPNAKLYRCALQANPFLSKSTTTPNPASASSSPLPKPPCTLFVVFDFGPMSLAAGGCSTGRPLPALIARDHSLAKAETEVPITSSADRA